MADRRAARRARRQSDSPTRGTVVVDSGAVARLAEGSEEAMALVRALCERGWQLVVPAVVLVECLTGDGGRDARANRFLRAVNHFMPTTETNARAAAALRRRTRNPSVVDALVAEAALRLAGEAIVLTTDPKDIETLLGRERAGVRVLAC